jgi:hypothetical protein
LAFVGDIRLKSRPKHFLLFSLWLEQAKSETIDPLLAANIYSNSIASLSFQFL